jgi:hypothetical protein
MKTFNYIFCFLFIVFAALQYNDPDPYIWMPIYLYSSAFCYLAAKKKFYPIAYAAGIFVYAVYALFLFFDKTGVLNWAKEHHAENIAGTMKATEPWIEESREFFGLLIVIAVMAFNWVYSSKSVKSNRQ